MSLTLFNYETSVVYIPDNVEKGFLYLDSLEEYEILVNKEIMTKYANKIGVSLKYLDHTQHIEYQEEAFRRLDKAMSKLLALRWIRYIPKTDKGKNAITIDTVPTEITGNKFYAVKVGRKTGIFATWEETAAQVANFPNNKFKKFSTLQEAKEFLEQ